MTRMTRTSPELMRAFEVLIPSTKSTNGKPSDNEQYCGLCFGCGYEHDRCKCTAG